MSEIIILGLSIVSVVLLVLANLQLRTIMSTQAQAAQQVRELNTQLIKISGESTRNLEAIKRLTDIINSGNTEVSPELQQALDEAQTTAQGLDDLTPDITDGSGSTGETARGPNAQVEL